jgi:hypothetical protein
LTLLDDSRLGTVIISILFNTVKRYWWQARILDLSIVIKLFLGIIGLYYTDWRHPPLVLVLLLIYLQETRLLVIISYIILNAYRLIWTFLFPVFTQESMGVWWRINVAPTIIGKLIIYCWKRVVTGCLILMLIMVFGQNLPLRAIMHSDRLLLLLLL